MILFRKVLLRQRESFQKRIFSITREQSKSRFFLNTEFPKTDSKIFFKFTVLKKSTPNRQSQSQTFKSPNLRNLQRKIANLIMYFNFKIYYRTLSSVGYFKLQLSIGILSFLSLTNLLLKIEISEPVSILKEHSFSYFSSIREMIHSRLSSIYIINTSFVIVQGIKSASRIHPAKLD